MPFLLVQQKLSIAKKVLVGKLKHATEQSLQTVDFLNSVSLEVMQAAAIYLLPLCRNEVSETTSMLVQTLLQNAQLAGFNDDSSFSSTSDPSEFDAKRHLWNELCVLALRGSSLDTPSTNTPTLLSPPSIPPRTDSTLSHLRHACYALHQQILSSATDPSRLAHTLRAQRKHLEAHYLQPLDPSLPLHRYARVVATLLIAGADFVLFYPLYAPGRTRYQGRLRERCVFILSPFPCLSKSTILLCLISGLDTQLIRLAKGSLLRSSLDLLESAAALETDPGFAAWAWCAGSYQSYTCILYLLVIVIEGEEEGAGMGMGEGCGILEEPGIKDRISTLTDYIFGDSIGIPLAQRSMQVLAAVSGGMRRLGEMNEVVRVDSRMDGVGVEVGEGDRDGEGGGRERGGEGVQRNEEDRRESLFVSEMAFGAVLAEMNWEGGTGWG